MNMTTLKNYPCIYPHPQLTTKADVDVTQTLYDTWIHSGFEWKENLNKPEYQWFIIFFKFVYMTTSLTKNDEFLQPGLWILTSNKPTKVFSLTDTLNKGVDRNLYVTFCFY